MKAAPVIIGVLGLVVGLGAGRFLARDVSLAEPARGTRPAERNGSRATPPPSRTVEEKHDFQSLMERRRRTGGTAPEMRAKLERMSVEALVKLLAEVNARDAGERYESMANEEVSRAVAAELFRRKGMGAIEEVEKEPDRNLRFLMSGAFYYVISKESPLMAREWLERRRKEYGLGSSDIPNALMIDGATRRGVVELIALHERDGSKWGKRQGFPGAELPEDFDFGMLVRHFPTDDNYGMKRAMTSWGVKDKEAAMAVMRENISQHGGKAAANFGAVVTGVAVVEGDEKAAEWMVAQLDSLPEEARKEALGSFRRGIPDMQTQSMNDATVTAIAAKLPNAEDRVQVVGSSLSAWAEPEANVRMLRGLPTAAEREQALVKALPGLKGYGKEKLRKLVYQMDFSEEARERVMGDLGMPMSVPLRGF